MCFLKLPLTLLLDLKVYIFVEVDSVIAHVVMLWAKPDDKSVSITLLSVAPSFIHMVQMQTSVIADVKILTAEITFFCILHETLHTLLSPALLSVCPAQCHRR